MSEKLEPQLLQLEYRHEPWKLLVCCILLNRTQRKQVDRVVNDLFLDYPTPEALATAREDELRDLLYPLGMSRTRARRLIEFAEGWLSGHEIVQIPGIGKYALDSYRIFVEGDLTVSPTDKELRRWMAWRAEVTP